MGKQNRRRFAVLGTALAMLGLATGILAAAPWGRRFLASWWNPARKTAAAVSIDHNAYSFEEVLQYARRSVPEDLAKKSGLNPRDLLALHLEDFILTETVRLDYRKSTRGIPPGDLENHIIFRALPPEPDLRRDALDVIATNYAFIQQNEDVTQVSDEEIRRYYQNHPNEFFRRERIRLAQIVFDDENLARQVYHQILISPEVFDYYADIGKQSPEGRHYLGLFHGLVGYLEIEVLPDFLKETVSSLPVGSVSPPVRVGDKYAVYKVVGRRPAGVAPIDEVYETIRDRLREMKIRKRIPIWVRRLLHRHRVRIHWRTLGLNPRDVIWRWLPPDVVRELSTEELR